MESGNCPSCGAELSIPIECGSCNDDLLATVHFNHLTPREAELAALLAEECGEVVQMVGKILRHGCHSWHPNDPNKTPNITLLEREIGDVLAAVDLMGLCTKTIERAKQAKLARVGKYLHHASTPARRNVKETATAPKEAVAIEALDGILRARVAGLLLDGQKRNLCR